MTDLNRRPPIVALVEGGDSWATPQEIFDAFDWEFGFTLDGAASAKNAKVPKFFSIEDDSLSQSWANERVWVNPPYSDIRPWVGKASLREADVVAMLLPVRTGTDWWRLYVMDPDGNMLCDGLRFFRKRVRFVGATGSPSWETVLAIWRRSL